MSFVDLYIYLNALVGADSEGYTALHDGSHDDSIIPITLITLLLFYHVKMANK